jgi:eukaryotic-like serine/threonine-protein kinase
MTLVREAYRDAVLSQGVVLGDRYLLHESIATGGMGDVWRGTDVLLKREVAVKVLLPSLVSDLDFIIRFRAEARMMAALRHPGIVQVYDVGQATLVSGVRVDFLVMEYVHGTPLSSRIKAGQLSIPEVMSVVAQTAQALHVTHDAGIIHRDIKPSNLLVRPDGSIVLVDFGVARSVNMTGITGTNVVLGTAYYMAPEQVAGRPVSPATDIYALGAVAYCCITGHPPFTGDDTLQVAYQHLQDEPPALPAEVPAPVAALIARTLAKDPSDRHPSAADLADAARATQRSSSAAPPATAFGAMVGAAASRPKRLPETAPPTARTGRFSSTTLSTVAVATAIALIGLVAALVLRPWANQAHSEEPVAKTSAASSIPGTAPEKVNKTSISAAAATPTQSVHPIQGGAHLTPSPTATPINVPTATPTTTAKSVQTGTPTGTTTKANPYTPVQVCGTGYEVIDSAPLTRNGDLQATVYLLYNSGNGYNCTVTLKNAYVGASTAVSAYLQVEGHTGKTDSGSYSYYAGPVRASAPGACVKWGGSAGGASYTSPYQHCG